jgi:hypothetical protein
MRTLVVVAACLTGGTALAQPTEPPPGGEQTPPNPTPPNPTPPTPTPVPMQPQPMPAMPQPAPEEPPRPTEFSVGIGVGYIFPTSLQTPNVASVRFRLPTGLTFEPRVALASTKDSVDTGTPVDNKTTDIGAGTVIRYPTMMHGKFDLELLGAVDIDIVTQDPAMDDNNTTTTTARISYGLAVNYWLTRHWNVSFTADNPVVSFTRVRQEMGPMNVLVTSETTIGAIFDPTVTVMIHIFH